MRSGSTTPGTGEHWQEWVAEPVTRYPIAPHQARAILALFGEMAALGIDLRAMFDHVLASAVEMMEGGAREEGS